MSNGSSTANLSWLDGVAALNATLDGNDSAAADDEGGGWPMVPDDPWDGSPYPSRYSKLSFVATAFVVTCIMILIVVGNMLVCIAIATEKTLKTIQNWFIASLAVSDFLIGLIIMPFSLAKELMGYWIFGSLWCDVHAALDVLICTASINNLCLISLDRYWSVTHAVEYLKKRTASRAMAMICFVWLLSALISLPPLVGWKKSQQASDYPQCSVSEDVGYVLYSALGSFYVPAVVMVFVYIRIFLAARSRARRHVKKQARHVPELTNDPVRDKSTTTTTTTCTSFSNPSPPDSSAAAHKMNGGGGGGGGGAQRRGILPSAAPQIIIETPEEPSSTPPSPPLPSRRQEGLGGLRAPEVGLRADDSEAAPLQGSHDAPGLLSAPQSRIARSPYGSTLSLNERDEDSELCESSNAAGGESSGGSGGGTTGKRGGRPTPTSKRRPAPPQGLTYAVARHSPSDAERHKRKLAKARERRATMILGLIMAAFILAWLPFFVLYVLGALCKRCDISGTVFAVAFWLGYCNSAVNPIIYTIFNRDFRKAFRKILFK